MPSSKIKQHKSNLHPRNKNRDRYNLEEMEITSPGLSKYIKLNKHGVKSINFSNPDGVRALNKAILHHYYDIANWEFPKENLCPPIPGRADYLHHIAELLRESNKGKIPVGDRVTCLDIGTGASCIYPIIGVVEYKWNFIASDISAKSIESAQQIVDSNPALNGKVDCKVQNNPKHILKGIIDKPDKIDVVICNPPFHASIEDARKGSARKVRNLTGKKTQSPRLNFSGNEHELVYPGGEIQFISKMIAESLAFSENCCWFTTLVSKDANLKKVYQLLDRYSPSDVRTIEMSTGNKTSRIVAWSFLNAQERINWQENK